MSVEVWQISVRAWKVGVVFREIMEVRQMGVVFRRAWGSGDVVSGGHRLTGPVSHGVQLSKLW